MKKLFLIIVLVMVCGSLAQGAHAQSVLKLGQRVENRVASATAREDASLATLKARADEMITNRVNSLQQLLTRIQRDTRLSDADKTSVTTDITTTLTDLNALKTKIDADTDLTTMRSDTKSIVTNYRIYEIFEPKVRLLIVINNLQTENDKLSSLSGQIQTLLTQLKSQGKDTTAAQTALDDINTQTAAINTLLTTDKTLVSNVTVSTSNPQSVFTQVRKDMTTVRNDFTKIRSDIQTIKSNFQAMIPHATSATQSAQ